MKELIIVCVFLVLLTGLYGGHVVKKISSGTLYLVGLCGLETLYSSRKVKSRMAKYTYLVCGFLVVLIAFFSLETLLLQWGRF